MTTELQVESMRELGARLQLARKAARKTQDDAATALSVARTTITAIEKGDRRVQARELVVLAELYGKSLNELLRTGQSTRPLAVQLRASLSRDGAETSALEPYFAEFQTLAEDYAHLERLCESPMPRRYPAERKLGGIPAEELAEDLANVERERLGLGDGPVHRLRDTLEREVGLRIFCMQLPSKVSGMFIYDDELGGCIAANAKHAVERVRQTIVHEYGHFLTLRHQPSIDEDKQYRRVPEGERFAYAFGPAFLMPQMGLRRRVNQVKAAKGEGMTNADLLSLADYYGTSLESLARRLEQFKLVSRGTWEKLSRRPLRVGEARRLLKLDGQQENVDVFPVRYTLLAVTAFHLGHLTEGQFARFLRVGIVQARRVYGEHSEQLTPV